MKKISLAIIVLNYQNFSDTIECLDSIFQDEHDEINVFVVDNASTNDSMKQLQHWASKQVFPYHYYHENDFKYYDRSENVKLFLIQSAFNNGYAAGNNLGIKFALEQNKFDFFWILNNDTILQKDTIANVISFLGISDADLLGTPLFDQDTQQLQAYCGHINFFTGASSYVVDTDKINNNYNYIHGASLIIKKDTIAKIGLLPEEYFLYYEEVDYCFKARKNGLKTTIIFNAKVFHKEYGNTQDTNSDIAMLKLTNRIIFYKKYFSHRVGLYLGVLLSIVYKAITGRYTLALKIIKKLLQKGTR